MADNDSGIAFVSGFLLGGVLGAAIGMLLAPKSGAETRADIVEHSDVWKHRAEDLAGQISQNIAPTIETLRQQVSPAVEVVRERMGMEPVLMEPEPADQDITSAEPVESAETETEEDAPSTASSTTPATST